MQIIFNNKFCGGNCCLGSRKGVRPFPRKKVTEWENKKPNFYGFFQSTTVRKKNEERVIASPRGNVINSFYSNIRSVALNTSYKLCAMILMRSWRGSDTHTCNETASSHYTTSSVMLLLQHLFIWFSFVFAFYFVFILYCWLDFFARVWIFRNKTYIPECL